MGGPWREKKPGGNGKLMISMRLRKRIAPLLQGGDIVDELTVLLSRDMLCHYPSKKRNTIPTQALPSLFSRFLPCLLAVLSSVRLSLTSASSVCWSIERIPFRNAWWYHLTISNPGLKSPRSIDDLWIAQMIIFFCFVLDITQSSFT